MNTSKKALSMNEMEQVTGGHVGDTVKKYYNKTVNWFYYTAVPAGDEAAKAAKNFGEDMARTTSNLGKAAVNWIKGLFD